MVKLTVRIFFEGGGAKGSPNSTLDSECRKSFQRLFEKLGFRGRWPKVIPHGSRETAFREFKRTLKKPLPDVYPVLLVDSEGPVSKPAWEHLHAQSKKWQRPAGANDDQAQLMVQCMETWLIADRTVLKDFFGQNFQENSLPAPNDLESRTVNDVQRSLKKATRGCRKTYEKGSISFQLLAKLDPAVLKQQLPHFARLCEVLESKLNKSR